MILTSLLATTYSWSCSSDSTSVSVSSLPSVSSSSLLLPPDYLLTNTTYTFMMTAQFPISAALKKRPCGRHDKSNCCHDGSASAVWKLHCQSCARSGLADQVRQHFCWPLIVFFPLSACESLSIRELVFCFCM